MEPTHTNISGHAQPLASGQTVAPGDTATLNLTDAHDRALLASGAFATTETSTDYGALKHDQLQALADAAALDVKGTGKDGSVTNADLEKALTANDKKSKEG